VQAFSFALQEELHDYYRLLAVLEQELARKVLAKDQPPSADASSDSSKWVESVDPKGTSGLTLLRLRAWMQEPMDRMCLMARLVDSASPLAGGTSRCLCQSECQSLHQYHSLHQYQYICQSLSVSVSVSVSLSVAVSVSVSESVSVSVQVSVSVSAACLVNERSCE
jgi:hypothetical protein